jgi:glucokinase
LLQRFDHVGIERVCSGIGIPNIYEYLRDMEKIAERPDFAELLSTSNDATRIIVTEAVDSANPSELCKATLEMFVTILASEASNLVLKVLGTGGVYITGSLAVRSVRLLQAPAFVKAFTNKGRFKELMARVPIHVITAKAALIGAAAYGLDFLYRDLATDAMASARLGI